VAKSSGKIWIILLFSQKLPKTSTRPIGQSSPNLGSMLLSFANFLLKKWRFSQNPML
jgi:hypothetical protein